MKFLRTASTGRLLATLAGLVIAIGGGTAIAVAATAGGPVPRPRPLADSLHSALTARPVDGISADIQFTNNLISSTDFTGASTDPILQGATGRLWLSKAHGLRLELQSTNGDSQIVVDKDAFWISDPASQTVYEGTLPSESSARHAGSDSSPDSGVPSLAQIQSDINRLVAHVNLSGARTSDPGDIAGQPSYSVTISPKHDGGLLGSASLAWDAVTGTPLEVAVYRGDSTPVLSLKATNISFGSVPASDYAVSPPAGYKVVKVDAADAHPAGSRLSRAAGRKVTGVKAVAGQLPFTLAAPARLVGLPRQQVRLLDWGGAPAALVTYGRDLGGVAVLEQRATAGGRDGEGSTGSGSGSGSGGELSLPTVSIGGATGTELSTALGTVVRWTSGGVAYTVLGSVPPAAAELAAKALTP